MSWVWQLGGIASQVYQDAAAGGFQSAWARNSNGVVSHMKKNVAGQKIGIQMVSATDGSAFTGSTTVYITGDAGTQAIGSVGSGICTHEGNGFHTYAPAQSETNYDHIAFTFIGTGAVPSTVQLFTTFPQTGDSFALIGATGSGLTSLATQASVNTIDDFLDTEIAAIKAKTDSMTFTTANQLDVQVLSMANNSLTAAAINSDAITAAKLAADVTTELQSGLATAASIAALNNLSSTDVATAVWNAATATYGAAGSYGLLIETNLDAQVSTRFPTVNYTSPLNFSDIRTAVGLASANLDTQLAAIDTVVDAVKVKTDQMTFTVANQLDANTESINGTTVLGNGTSGNLWRGS